MADKTSHEKFGEAIEFAEKNKGKVAPDEEAADWLRALTYGLAELNHLVLGIARSKGVR